MTTSIYRFDRLGKALDTATSRDALFATPEFRECLFAELDQLLPDQGILSLDVFDTLVLRDNSSELTRFFEIGDRMADVVKQAPRPDKAPEIAGIDAFLARHLGTKATYRAAAKVKGCREGSLTEIHQVASRMLVGSDRLMNDFINLEINYESDRIRPNALLVDYIAMHRSKGGRVVLLSDMYMHADQISRLLTLVGVSPASYDLLISSADTKLTKASGGIFSLVEKKMEMSGKSFCHVGDSLLGDFRRPVEFGWSAIHLPVPQMEIVERRRDHLATATMLESKFGVTIDIAMPH